MSKIYVKDQEDEWLQDYYLPALSKPMNLSYSGGKSYKLNKVFNRVIAPLTNSLKVKSKRDYKNELDVFIYHAAKAIRRGHDSMVVDRDSNNFNNKAISYINWIDLLCNMELLGYCYNFIGNKGNEYSEDKIKYKTHLSVVTFSEEFISMFNTIPSPLYPKQDKPKPKDLLQLREKVSILDEKGNPKLDKKGRPTFKKVKLEGTIRGGKPFREVVTGINNHLSACSITTKNGKSLHVDYHMLFGNTVHRYGRFYSSYSNLTKLQRLSLIFDGECVVERDYRGQHCSILYSREGIILEPSFEPYLTNNIDQILSGFDVSLRRGMYKVALIACLSAKTRVGVSSSVKNGLESSGFDIPNGLASLIVNDLKSHNQGIAHYFGTDMSAELQSIDSKIAGIVMTRLIPYGKSFMCFHDSFIVPESLSDVLINLMTLAWDEVVGNPENCIIK